MEQRNAVPQGTARPRPPRTAEERQRDRRLALSLLTRLAAAAAALTVLLGGSTAALSTLFHVRTAVSFLVFSLLYTPCVAAISAVKREMGSGWHALTVAVFQTGVAWIMAFLLFQIGSIFIH